MPFILALLSNHIDGLKARLITRCILNHIQKDANLLSELKDSAKSKSALSNAEKLLKLEQLKKNISNRTLISQSAKRNRETTALGLKNDSQ